MKKLSEDKLKTAVAEVVTANNPYIEKSIQFFISMKPRYIWNGNTYNKEKLDEEYAKTAEKDIRSGYRDRMLGYYDKWYRYRRDDSGRAYDVGVKLAMEESDCVEQLTFIPCIGGV